LNRLLAITFGQNSCHEIEHELPFSRSALRGIPLEGLDPIIHFGKKCVAFEDAPDGSIAARFTDGSTTTADVLVGADGVSSRVRAQLLPHAERVETGIVAVSGKCGQRWSV
jgi:2-polyprenyl-6-methoxyphenol hydroxylase-like FAD-dependent oxidoreductase